MYAIVDIAGQQFKVKEGQKIFVHRLDAEEGAEVEFEKVLLIDNEGKITIGEPNIKDAAVEGKIIAHVRGDKVIVFKKKRRKGYQKRSGHRQDFSQIEIVTINEKFSPKKTEKKEKKAEPVAEAVVEAPVKKAPQAKKEVAEKKEAKPKAAAKAAPKAPAKAATKAAPKAAPKAAAKTAAKSTAKKAEPKSSATKPKSKKA